MLSFTIFNNAPLQGQYGSSSTINLPSSKHLQEKKKVTLEMNLNCPDKFDDSCPAWDHVVRMFVCCDDEHVCPTCEPNIWLASTNEISPPKCGQEIARWITPFKRGQGRWLTDITPLRSLLPGNAQCTFRIFTVAWTTSTWSTTVKLHYWNDADGDETLNMDTQNNFEYKWFPLWNGNFDFDLEYNRKFESISVHSSTHLLSAQLHILITGHGSDVNGCGEFCPIKHEIDVGMNDSKYTSTLEFSQAGSLWGCWNKTDSGAMPNEHGTWLYGESVVKFVLLFAAF